MRIRKFRTEDAGKVSHLIRKTMRHSLIKCYSKKVVDALCRANTPKNLLIRAKTREYFLAVDKGLIVGVNGIKDDEVKTFFVDPKYHGRGVGRLLMQNLEIIAKKRGIKVLMVKSSLFAQGFYKTLGFRRIKRLTSEVGTQKFFDTLMQKKL